MAYNGGSVVAMKGKNCVAIAADRRFGVQALTISCDFQKTFEVNNRLFYGLAGLGTDVQTLYVLYLHVL
jgi:20S proteasome subunit beta 3